MTGGSASTGLEDPRRVLVVVGTRPEAVKMAPVLRGLRSLGNGVEPRLVLTGQHTDLVDEALASFRLKAHWELGIMRPDQSLYDVAHGCLDGLRAVMEEWRPHLILVQGDTASVFLASLVGYFEGVATGHVEAGLRSGDLRRPFPEEGFRRMAGVLAQLHFAPTEGARENLLREGASPERIHVTGNTVVDAVLEIADREQPPRNEILRRLLARDGEPFLLLTAHRRESFGEPLERIFRGVLDLVAARPGLEVLYPVHPNPHVREAADRVLGGHPRIHLERPLAYGDLVAALQGAALVLTDSGGIQEEAPTFGTPVLVLREVTERPEGVEAGHARIVGFDPGLLIREAQAFLDEDPEAREGRRGRNPYGDGRAGERIAAVVDRFLQEEVPSG